MRKKAESLFSHEMYPFLSIADSLCEDEKLESLISELVRFGYQLFDQQWLLGGSQEINIYWFTRGEDELVLQNETYEGYKLFGKTSLLDEIRHLAK